MYTEECLARSGVWKRRVHGGLLKLEVDRLVMEGPGREPTAATAGGRAREEAGGLSHYRTY